jgi:hypothetical protein
MNASRQKGDRRERQIAHRLSAVRGVIAERVPLSGAANGSFSGDLLLSIGSTKMRAEVKARSTAAGFRTVLGWLGNNDLLVLVPDRRDPYVLMPWWRFQQLLEAYANAATYRADGRDAEE